MWDKLPDPYAEPRDPAHKDLPLDAIKDLYFPDKVPFGNIVRQGNGTGEVWLCTFFFGVGCGFIDLLHCVL